MWGKAFSQIIWGKKPVLVRGEKSHIRGEFFLSIIYFNIRWAVGGNNFLIDRGREGGGNKNHATKNNAPSEWSHFSGNIKLWSGIYIQNNNFLGGVIIFFLSSPIPIDILLLIFLLYSFLPLFFFFSFFSIFFFFSLSFFSFLFPSFSFPFPSFLFFFSFPFSFFFLPFPLFLSVLKNFPKTP